MIFFPPQKTLLFFDRSQQKKILHNTKSQCKNFLQMMTNNQN
jgi:hypothetical protein